jgi:tetratricopeptide (TPR) repeat protein
LLSRARFLLLALSLLPALAGAPSGRPPERPGGESGIPALVEEARKLVERESWEAALEAYRRLAAEDPHHPDAHLGIVLMQARRGDLGSVAALLDSLPGGSGPGRAYAAGVLDALEGRLGEAAGRLLRALDLYRARRHAAGEAACRTALGNVHLWSARPAEAAREYRTALRILDRLGDRRGVADLLLNLAAVRRGRGDLEGAQADQTRAARIYEEIGDRDGQAAVLASMGEALFARGDLGGAAEVFERAAAIRRRLGDRPGEASALDRLGVARTALGDVEEAEGALLRAREIAVDLADRSSEAAILNDLASLRFAQGEYADALLLQSRALDMYRALGGGGPVSGEATSLINLGAIEHAIGEEDSALRRLRRAVELFQALGDRRGEAVARNNLGVVLADKGLPERALAELRESIRIREEIGDERGAAFSRYNAAEPLRRLGGAEEAARHLEAALMTYRETGDRRGQAFVLNGIGDLHGIAGKTGSALRAYREALGLALGSALAEEEAAARSGIARSLEASGREVDALEEYGRAIERAEATRTRLLSAELKAGYLEGKLGNYEGAVRLLAKRAGRGDAAAAARAFDIAERARARSLVELLAEALAGLRARIDPDTRRRERILLARAASAARQAETAPDEGARSRARRMLSAAEEALRLLEVEIRKTAPAYAEAAYPAPATLDEVRASILSEGEVLLEYLLAEPASFLWIVDGAGVSLREIPGRSTLESIAGRFVEALGAGGGDLGGEAPEQEPGQAARRALLPAPLPPGARVVVVPDGVLHRLPFEALPEEGRPLVEDHEFVYAPSISALRLLRAAPAGTTDADFLGVGDPEIPQGGAGGPPLPFSREEIRRVAALFPPGRAVLLEGASATEDAVASLDLARFRFIHLAAHGLPDEAAPRRSGILLGAGGGARDGLLSAAEILELKLSAQVVTLSACGSGIGRLVGGEGIVGLARAFLYAGARSVVVSLWNVDDRSAADLMEAFYRGLLGGRPPAAALREAKRAFLASSVPGYRMPARWAPFVLVGDPGSAPGAPAAEGGRRP